MGLFADDLTGFLKNDHSLIKFMELVEAFRECKKLASDEPISWKTILLHYLKPVGGKLILGCSFDVKMLPIKLPPFYEDCLKSLAKCLVATNQCEELTIDINATLQTIIWNNKFICIDGKSVFFKTLAKKGILRIGDLITENNELITKRKARELNLTPLDLFRLVSVVKRPAKCVARLTKTFLSL